MAITVRSTFKSGQITQLRRILGGTCERLLPCLEEAILVYRNDDAKKHADAAARLEDASRELLQSLEASAPLVQKACSLGYIPSVPPHGRSLVSLFDIAVGRVRWATGDKNRVALDELVKGAREWKTQAGSEARVALVLRIGTAMRQAGLRMAKGADGKWARTVEVVYAAAEIDVGSGRFEDIRNAHKKLREVHSRSNGI